MPFDVISTVPLSGYAPSTALGIDTTTAQLYTSGLDQMWEAVGGGGANFPINTDITAMEGIPNTLINGSGYELGTPGSGTGIVVNSDSIAGGVIGGSSEGFALGFGLGSGSGATLLLSDASGHGVTLSGAGGLTMNGGIVSGTVQTTGNIILGNGGTVETDDMMNFTPGTPLTITAQSITAQAGLIFDSGASVSLQNLFGLRNYPTQSTVGAAGGASAIPGAPSIWLQLSINGTVYVFPGWAQA